MVSLETYGVRETPRLLTWSVEALRAYSRALADMRSADTVLVSRYDGRQTLEGGCYDNTETMRSSTSRRCIDSRGDTPAPLAVLLVTTATYTYHM